jgi:type 1 glutamine amidotransferase
MAMTSRTMASESTFAESSMWRLGKTARRGMAVSSALSTTADTYFAGVCSLPRHVGFRALIFSRTTGFRHTECIEQGTAAIADMGSRGQFSVEATEDAAAFDDAELAGYDVVIWLSTSGDVLADGQKRAFERYIRAGHGFVGIHLAAGTEYDWPWYGGLVGAYFRDHPGLVNPQFQMATIDVEDRGTAATSMLPSRWTREEEWYSFRSNPRRDVHVLLSVDERTYDPRGYSKPDGSAPMGDHPIAWCRRYDGGRSFYTALGHKGVYWTEPLLLGHVRGGIEMAAGLAPLPAHSAAMRPPST